MASRGPRSIGMSNERRPGEIPGAITRRQVQVLAAYVACGASVARAAQEVGIRPSTAKRHLADLRQRSGMTTEQLIYAGRAAGWLTVPSLEPVARTAAQRPVSSAVGGG